jgi:hypothetical protein
MTKGSELLATAAVALEMAGGQYQFVEDTPPTPTELGSAEDGQE